MVKASHILTIFLFAITESDLKELKQHFTMEPENKFVKLESSLTLACRIMNQAGTVQWTRDGFGLGLGKNLHGFPRYKIVGRTEEGDWSLSISPVKLEDEAEYQCQVGGSPGQLPIRSKKVKVTVKIPPEPPRILQADSSGRLSASEGSTLSLTCISKGGKPAASITWKLSRTEVMDGVTTRTELETNGFRYTTISSLQINIVKSSHGKILSCEAQNGAEQSVQTTSVTISVRYPPVVKIKRITNTNSEIDPGAVKEGAQLKLICEAEGNPEQFLYKWSVDDHNVNGISSMWTVEDNMFLIPGVTREMLHMKIKCSATNSEGTGTDIIVVDVSYGPSHISISGEKTGLAGQTIHLDCIVQSHPPPSITWYKVAAKSSQIAGYGPNISFEINRENEARYICEANTVGFTAVRSKPVMVILLRSPTITTQDEIYYGDILETSQVVCSADMSPHNAQFSWSYKGEELAKNGYNHEIINTDSSSSGRSKLIIKTTQENDFGVYQCTATNNLGKDVALMELRRRGSLTSGSLLVSCLLGVALTILIIVTVFYLRRHFNLTQFYPNHVKLFSKQQLNPSPLKSATDEKSRRLGGNSSKSEISPCSSEEFFQNFPKRATLRSSNNGNGCYKPITKSPTLDHSQLKTCAHPTIKLFGSGGTNSETKSCQTFSNDHDKKSKMVSDESAHVSQDIPAMAPPDITQVSSVLETQSSSENFPVPQQTNANLTSDRKRRRHETGNGRAQKSAYSRSQYSSNDILSCPVYPHQHQPAVNYYANSIYLSRDVPLLFRNGVFVEILDILTFIT